MDSFKSWFEATGTVGAAAAGQWPDMPIEGDEFHRKLGGKSRPKTVAWGDFADSPKRGKLDPRRMYAMPLRKEEFNNVEAILNTMTPADFAGNNDKYADKTKRLVLADALQDDNRNEEAGLVRDLNQVVYYNKDTGKFAKGELRYQEIDFSDNYPHEDNKIYDILQKQGMDEVVEYLTKKYHTINSRPEKGFYRNGADKVYENNSYVLVIELANRYSPRSGSPIVYVHKKLIVPGK